MSRVSEFTAIIDPNNRAASVRVPSGAQILQFQVKGQIITAYALAIDPNAPQETRTFIGVDTDQDLPVPTNPERYAPNPYNYRQSFQRPNGSWIHIFELQAPLPMMAV
jgi:hypothetical protein